MSVDEKKFKYIEKVLSCNGSDPQKHGYTKKDFDLIRKELSNFEEIPKFITDSQILLFSLGTNGDKDEFINKMRLFHKYRREMPELFGDRDPRSMKIMHSLENQFFIPLPVLPQNCNAFLFGFFDGDPKNYYFFSTAKVFNMMCEGSIMKSEERPDTIFILDFEKVRFGHIFRVSFSGCMKAIQYLEQAVPLNIKEVHVLNAVSFMGFIFKLMRPFTSTSLMSKVKVHTSNIDWDDFYKNHIPKSHLPRDYGGDLESIDELNEKQKKSLDDLRDYFIYEEKRLNFELDNYAEHLQ